ncbi:Arginine/serine-rich splicing factor 35 [Heracleum sosnowskyi]|uniref:Arginine/serine-rich splicing factor 35 n=1 Tax=Heracleum sosnowskyi TaxID=360622 RepID=A0AAD8IXS9_9APIA|nr:Arginine/serine-rich splicing factor 35 [Heracleum sosnowskyi]
MKPIFCGNFEYDARQSDLERLFRKYGKVDRVDMKSGFAFVYMEDEGDAEYAIRKLDNLEFGRKGRRLRVEWTKQERSTRKPDNSRRSSANMRPSKTLFVINFDPYHTRTRDLERHFDPYGKILNIRIRKNFAFIQFETQEDAIKALEATNMSKLMDRVISVEYAIKDDDDRVRDRSPRRRNDDRGRSPSPYRRERGSPDYSHGPGRGRSPSPYRRERASPDYGRGGSGTPNGRVRKSHGRGGSVSPNGRERKSDYGRGGSRSPIGRERRSDFGRGSRSPVGGDRKPDNGRGGSRSPNGRERRSDFGRGSRSPVGGDRKPDYGRGSPDRRGRKSDYGVVQSPSPPNGRERISNYGHGRISSPQRELVSPDPVRRSSPRERLSPEYDHGHSPSPRTEKVSPDGYNHEASPDAKPEIGDSPGYSGGDSPLHDRYSSRSPPPARERSRS